MHKFLVLLVIGFVLLPGKNIAAGQHPWQDNSLTNDQRVEALLGAMTMDEKMSQLLADSPGIPRLGILPYHWWNEALHGVARNGRATVFPQNIGMAASFDPDLVQRIAAAIAHEARAKFNVAQSLENYVRYTGLTFWSPNVNLFRDPRWGRGMETFGEDPFLASRLGVGFVKGLQGDNTGHMKAAACAKHYVVHSGPEALRHEFNAVAPKRDFYESYLPAFEALVREGDVECVMCAYNRTDGEPVCASERLLQGILRDQWGFEGHVVSDCRAVIDIYLNHKVAADETEAAAMALKAGTDLNCGNSYKLLPDALEKGLIDESDVNVALRRLLHSKLKLGFFDESTPWSELGPEVVEQADHVELAREAAQKSIVMLKNNGVLPMDRNIRSLFITGPFASTSEVLLGNYYGLSSDTVSILDGIVGKVSAGTAIDYRYSQFPMQPNAAKGGRRAGKARSADATIVVLGLSGLYEGEEGAAVGSPTHGDRPDLNLPEVQLDFLRELRRNNEKPIIVVLTGGGPFAMPEVDELADAILFAWYPGQQGGRAVADVLFGEVSPSGRLPITFPVSADQLPPFEDYSMSGRTYKYMKESPLFPFGFGLSYSTFDYGELQVSSAVVKSGAPLEVSVPVTNTGGVDATEIVQLYLTSEDAAFDVPQSSLVGFQPVNLVAGETRSVTFTVAPEQMDVFDPEGQRQRVAGDYTLHAGGVSPGERGQELNGAPLRTARFTVR